MIRGSVRRCHSTARGLLNYTRTLSLSELVVPLGFDCDGFGMACLPLAWITINDTHSHFYEHEDDYEDSPSDFLVIQKGGYMHECCQVDCKHADVRFCAKCCKVYCVDCGREWEDKCMLSHYYSFSPLYTQPTYTTNPQIIYTAAGSTWCEH